MNAYKFNEDMAMALANDILHDLNDPESLLIADEEEAVEAKAEHKTIWESPLAVAIMEAAFDFLAGYPKNTLFCALKGKDVEESFNVVLGLAANGGLNKDSKRGYITAMSFVSQWMRQASQVVFYELYSREQSAQRQHEVDTAPANSQELSEAMQNFLAKMGIQYSSENGVRMADTDTDGDLIKDASVDALRTELVDIHDHFHMVHNACFVGAFGESPRDGGLGFTSLNVGKAWIELHSLEESYEKFVISYEDRKQAKEGAAREAASAVLAALVPTASKGNVGKGAARRLN